MSKTFLIGDTHFGHHNCYKFMHDDGTRIRPWALDADEGDEIMIRNWNNVVSPNDRVYHLGDVVIPRRALSKLSRLMGRKVLIRGNHDIFKLHEYAEYFDDIRGVWKLDDYILSHVPIHPESLARWCKGNIHGHLHGNRVMMPGTKIIDRRYINVSVEQVNATPIDFEEIKSGRFT
jgi:calcineurin-like phosphoesterase family protein